MSVGSRTLVPYFTVANADRLIAFIIDVFDAALVKEDRYANGRIQHARIKIGDSLIMLNEASDSYPANQSQMHVHVPDTDTTYKAALKAGAVSLMTPNQRPHGDRMAGVKDPCGNTWWIATAG